MPSLIRKCPSLPRTTCNAGIPFRDFPYLAICRASLPGSAPCRRVGGKCNSPGSTSMNSGIPGLVAEQLDCTANLSLWREPTSANLVHPNLRRVLAGQPGHGHEEAAAFGVEQAGAGRLLGGDLVQ